MKDKISIIMGIYNCSEYLHESINSILNQTYENWELIMCDDGSTDDTYHVAQEYAQKYKTKIILLKNDKNMGLNYTLNKCLKEATGKFIARQDGDDISLSNRLEKEYSFLHDNKEYDIVSSNMIYFDSNGEWGQSKMKNKPEKKDFINHSPFCHAACMVTKKAFDSVGGYTVDKKLLRVEDYHLWIKMYAKGFKGYNLSDYLYKMRNDEKALKRRTIKNRINEINVKKIAFKELKLPKKEYYKVYIPIMKLLVPSCMYRIIYRQKNKKRKIKSEIKEN